VLARRRVLVRFGWTGLIALLALSVPGLIRFLRPRSWGAAGRELDAGPIASYRNGPVATRWASRHRLWIVRRDSRLYALEARCTHLGCTPRWTPEEGVFHCPCHGSRFSTEGVALNGPAVLPLMRLAVRVEHGQLLVDPSRKAPLEQAERDPRFFVPV